MVEQICQWVDEHQQSMLDFCMQYMRFQSVTQNELEVQKWLLKRFEEINFDKVDFWAVDKDQKRPNLVGVKRGRSGKAALIINGHSDVVPVEEFERQQWKSDPWNPEIRDGKIWGRGANDMKGPNTAALFAVKAVIESGLNLADDLILEFVSTEEAMEHEIGTTAAIDRGYRSSFAIVVEPTNCEIHPVTTGSFSWELNIKGKPVHTCLKNQVIYPQRCEILVGEQVGVDAFTKALKVLRAWEHLEREWNLRWRHPILGGGGHPRGDMQGVGCFTITATLINAGDYFAAVPGWAQIKGNTYYPPWLKVEQILQEMQNAVNSVAAYDDWLKKNPPQLEILYHWPPSEIDPDHEGCKVLAKSYKEVTGEEAVFSGFRAVCDTTFLCQKGIPAVIFGPGDLSMGAHGPNEHVPIDQLLTACKTIAVTILNRCGCGKV